MAQAFARHGDGNAAVDLLRMINPAERTASPELVRRYRGEPYAVAADVSAAPGIEGAANWTWYTGSSAWMYRVWIEDVLGFHLRGATLTIRPSIPSHWPGFRIQYRYGDSLWKIEVERAATLGAIGIECDGVEVNDQIIVLADDGRDHTVRVAIASSDRLDHTVVSGLSLTQDK